MFKKVEDYVSYVNTAIDRYLLDLSKDPLVVSEAAKYSLVAGGKRIRPVLMQLSYEACGGKENIEPYLCAIEMVHTYSLIHDDLPAMDNDDYRRGRLTNHKVYGEATAILAGDALLSEAFRIMLDDLTKDLSVQKVEAIKILSHACSIEGMIGGQVIDMESENKTISKDVLDEMHARKTGAMIEAAVHMGAILAGAPETDIAKLSQYGQYVGKTFQIIDDVLDEVSTLEELGKPIGSDKEKHKNTYLNFYSVDECYQIAEDLTNKAVTLLQQIDGDTKLLEEIALKLIKRRN